MQARLSCLFGNPVGVTTRHCLSQCQIAAPVKRRNFLIHLLFLSHHQQTGDRDYRQRGDH
ncbi:hypothetical protein D3C78_1795190 [compost metagenome]